MNFLKDPSSDYRENFLIKFAYSLSTEKSHTSQSIDHSASWASGSIPEETSKVSHVVSKHSKEQTEQRLEPS